MVHQIATDDVMSAIEEAAKRTTSKAAPFAPAARTSHAEPAAAS
jgi:hypothetical protein